MDFSLSPKVRELQDRLTAFMEEYIYPAETAAEEEVAVSANPHHGAPGAIAVIQSTA